MVGEGIIVIDGIEHKVVFVDTIDGYDVKDPLTFKVITEGYTINEAIENYREMVRSNLC